MRVVQSNSFYFADIFSSLSCEDKVVPTYIGACSMSHRQMSCLVLLFFLRFRLELVVRKTSDLHADYSSVIGSLLVCIPISVLQMLV